MRLHLFICIFALLTPFSGFANGIDSNSQSAQAERIEQAIKAGRFTDVDAELTQADREHTRYINGRFFIDYITKDALSYAFADAPSSYVPLLDAWVQQKPDSYMALLLRGEGERALAWHIRGNGYADSVSKTQWEQFTFYNKKAAADFIASYQKNPHSALAATEMISLARDGGGKEASREWFETRHLNLS